MLPLHAVIISWAGMHDRAAAIAQALDGQVARLDVIYSNHDGLPEEGPGQWHGVPQAWYFGAKFRKSLDLHGGSGLPMLQVNADADCDDWAGLAARAAAAFVRAPDLGVWGPEIDVTPWPTWLVAPDPPADPDALADVLQTDGVVWALAPAVLARLAALDYGANNLGWGIDWAAVRFAGLDGLAVRRDRAVRIRHPQDRGYDNTEADSGMQAFLAQLSDADRAWIARTHATLTGRRLAAETAAPSSLQPDAPTGSPMTKAPSATKTQGTAKAAPAARTAPIAELHLVDGCVYAAADRVLDGADVRLLADTTEMAFTPCADPVAAGLLPRSLPLAAIAQDGCELQLNNHGIWQVPGWNTLRVAFDTATPATVALAAPIALPAGPARMELTMQLAVHRGRGLLVARVSGPDGRGGQRFETAFAARCEGGDQPANWQTLRMVLPPAEEPALLHLELDYKGGATAAAAVPHVFFVALPQLRSLGGDRSPSTPDLLQLATMPVQPVWHRADLPPAALMRRGPLTLMQGELRHDLRPAQPVQVRLLKDWGHVLELESSQALTAMAWVNGAPSFAVPLVQGQNVLRLPPRHLTGGHLRMELRDPAGMQVFWSDWVLSQRQLTALDHLQRESRSPWPSDLMPQTTHRYRALRAHCADGSPPEVMAQLDRAIEALEAGHDSLKLKPLSFPRIEAPDVSVVIPAHNKVKVTYAGLCALLLAWNKASFEVIVVDDASTDETARLEDLVDGITVIHNETAQRFIKACNAGVAAARGKYVVLLNNDTEPTVGWLDELIAAFGRFDKVGLVGSRLLYPDGRQQEAGGIIWGSGDPWNYGRLQNPWEPRFSYARQADYVSGAAMMTTREIWDRVGGLSSYLEPMYFEDTDFAFKIREAGLTTWYIPSSVVYHYEGLTSGTDTGSGFKRYQEVNRPKFKRRWAQAFAGFSKVGTAPDLEKDRGILGRVLFVDYTTPTPDRDAGSYAALQEIRLVQSLGYKVTFLPENLAWMGSYTEELQKMGVEVIVAPFYRGIDEFLEARAAEFDAFYITRYHVLNNVAPRIRKLVPEARIIMNGADLHYLRLLRKAMTEDDPAQIAAARHVRDEELAAMQTANLVLSYNETEHAVIDALSEGRVKVMTCPWVLDLPATVPPRDGRKGLSFLGSFQHHPNLEGIEWFITRVMSQLDHARPDIRLSIYGSRMPDTLKKLASDTIDPAGFVEDVADAYDRHLVFVAPLLSGAGIKGKVLSALAHGVPCVLSPVAAEGIGLRDGEDCLIARTPAEWVEGVTRLHDDAALWQQVSDNARRLAARRFSFDRARTQMRAAFEAVDLFRTVD